MSFAMQATVLLSGGIDSAACARFLSEKMATDCLFVDFGQSAAGAELVAAEAIASHLSLPFDVVIVRGQNDFGAGEITGRNAFLMFTAAVFKGERTNLIGCGIHAGTPYADCSQEFVVAMNQLLDHQTDGRLKIVAPFVEWSKQDVFDYFVGTGVPPALTYSCEVGSDPSCGECASCRDRLALGI